MPRTRADLQRELADLIRRSERLFAELAELKLADEKVQRKSTADDMKASKRKRSKRLGAKERR